MEENCSENLKNAPNWLKEMPKTDLHCHLGGSIRLNTLIELADKYGIELKDKDGARIPVNDVNKLKENLVCKNKSNKSLEKYLNSITICESVFKKAEAFQRVAYEVCEDAHKENVKIFELRFGPTRYESESLRLYEIVEATLDGLEKASKDFNMHAGLIICGIRTDEKATKKAAEIAVNYQEKGIVGFDLAGKEEGYRPKQFREIIKPVLNNFLPVTIHAGEEDTVGSIAEALIELNARRIGHGTSLRESTKLMEYMDEARIGIEICMTSNVDSGCVAAYETHPVRSYFQRNLRISINTDNRTISDTTVTNEYLMLMSKLGLKQEDIYKLGRHGIKSAFLDSRETKKSLDEFDAYKKG